jgi:RNA polymerase sigma factor (sigma-70 family)
VSESQFTSRLDVSIAKHVGLRQADARAIDAFARSLHVEDLALSAGCAAGHEGAWDHFVREVRPALNAAARSIAPGAWQDLADSLLAELFGLDVRDGRRRSLFDYYHGRARLSTWLRTVLAQRQVDRVRASARTVSLEDVGGDQRPDPAPAVSPRRTEHVALVQRALDEAVTGLDARDRLRLRLYYGEGLKLAPIGRLLGEHEATVSRKLDRTRREIRRLVERALLNAGLHPDAVRACMDEAAGAPELDVSRLLADDT